ncbi:hypothetical protein R3P38DRAFT_3293597 [Favolaschia claudopus]|uniref:Uncharacterized protein n=1 Tax=Favolaschia claudopus TaxID=2862362 RepID=A0AAV9ZI79_9AGAR
MSRVSADPARSSPPPTSPSPPSTPGIITEMAHGLFLAALPFTAYEELTRVQATAPGASATPGCPTSHIFEFALRDDLEDAVLERGSRRALVGLFGTAWCTQVFSASRQR